MICHVDSNYQFCFSELQEARRTNPSRKGNTMNYSRQREEVLDQLRMHKDHPTADVIFSELRGRDPSISLATVYRNLKLLSELGEIRKLSFVSGADRFDPTVSPHYHFVCERCGRVLDLPMQVAEGLDAEAQDFVSGRVTGHDLVFRGVCGQCSAEEKGNLSPGQEKS